MDKPASPRYRYSPRMIVPALRVFLGIRSSVIRDGALLLRGAYPLPRALNEENIPAATPFLLAVNHYDRPGLGAWWGICLILRAVAARRTREPRELHFMMAREWWYPRGWGRLVKQPFTRWLFGSIARAYGLITLPPVVGDYRGQAAAAIRHALRMTQGDDPQLVGLAPEGQTGANLGLCRPPEGAGLLMMLLTHDRIPCLPVGLFEDEKNTLTANFGSPFQLSAPRTPPRAERDRLAAREAMVAIGKLLPERMWGDYREEIRASLGCDSHRKREAEQIVT